MRFTFLTPVLVQALMLGAAATPAAATNAVASFAGASVFDVFASEDTIGWVFSTDTDLTVTALGWWTGDDLETASDREVGIWNDSGMLLGATTISAGAANDGSWRFVAITPITLAAGGIYHVGGDETFGDGDFYATNADEVNLAPGLSFLGAAVSFPATGFVFPGTVSPAVIGRFGPNFRFEPARAIIPEPGSWAMMIAGFGLVGSALRRRAVRTPAATLA